MFRTTVSAIVLYSALLVTPGQAQVFDHRPATAWSSAASAETRAAKTPSAKTTLYNLVMTGDQPESLSIEPFRTNGKCRRARDIAVDSLIFLGVNDQTKRQIYIWCDEPRASRRRKAIK